MAGPTSLKNAQIKDGAISRNKFVANLLAGTNLNLTDGNNDATITGLADGVGNHDAVNVQQLNAAISAITGVKTLRGALAGNADLTSNTTGNPYADASNEYAAGDVFQISSDGSLVVSDGVVPVNNGDEIVILQPVGDAAITVAQVFKIDNTEATDILRTGNIEDSLTSTSTADVLSANQGSVIKGLIDATEQIEKDEFDVTANGQTFTLTQPPLADAKHIEIKYNGLEITTSEYSISGSTLTVPGNEIGDCIIAKYRY